ncbi:dTDP-4-dehydrorhamnose reductase [Corynebacterium glaucum]|nr:dTDP-4-dehydrorhamnose reductase [Corynebacterium glaucum]
MSSKASKLNRMHETPIEGLVLYDLTVHEDNRGWFKENWVMGQGLKPVQNNVSFNHVAGTTRGMHAEPWDKWISVAKGRIFGAWVDMREGSPTRGQKFSAEIGPDTAVLVPRGVANGFQTLEDETAYVYLGNARYNPDGDYAFCSYKEIDWPLEPTQLSEADKNHPPFAEAPLVPARRILVTGADGQLGRALRKQWDDKRADFVTHEEFDITNPPELDYTQYWAIVNCAAYNDVDTANHERTTAWSVNADGVASLSRICKINDLTLVHISSDYIFDGTQEIHTEDEVASPINSYGASKAAGDTAARVPRKHYVVRTAWLFGEGSNFMETMAGYAERGESPDVVNDQHGRPTWAEDLARGIVHLLDTNAEYGVYNLTSDGDTASRDEIAMAVFTGMGSDPANIRSVTREEYIEIAGPQADRPANCTLDLTKIKATGFEPTNWRAALALYLDARSAK